MYSNPVYYADHLYVLDENNEYYDITDDKNSIDLKIPDTVTSIASHQFDKMAALKTVTISNSVTSIGGAAFSNCTSLESIEIPNSVTSIGASAFSNCTSLSSVVIGDSVTNIGDSAFSNCTSLENVYYNGTLEEWCNISFGFEGHPAYFVDHLYMLDENNEYYDVTDAKNNIDLKIPDTVTSIASRQFYKMAAIKSVIISDSVTSIGYEAFYECRELTSVIIPNSVINIDGYAFSGCKSLTVYCEALSKPSNWSEYWSEHYSNWGVKMIVVVWGYIK